MSLTLELLRSETDRESFYWPYSNGLISAVPHDCQRAKKADPPMVNNNNVTRNKVARNGLSPSDTRHSYYKCCVNVEVSALLEHWLGWDDKHHHNHAHSRAPLTNNNNNYSEEMADRLVSHLIEASSSLPTDAKANSQDPKLWVRKFCSEVGCDVLKKQDANGKTLLHHLLSGAVQRHLASTAKVLIEAGIPTDLADAQGDTALHLVKNYFGNEEVLDLVQTLAPHVNLDLQDAKGRTLLSYAAEAGDQCISLTRLLINLGASTHSDQLGKEAEVSAFAWFLRAQMRKLDVLDEDTLYVLCTAMASEVGPARLKAVIDRSMVALGSSPEAHGPIFRRIRGLTAHYWLRPPQLRSIAVKSIRRSLGPKRLSKGNEVMSRLKVPRKLQRFVTLEEKIPVATQNSNHIHNYSSDDTNSDN